MKMGAETAERLGNMERATTIYRAMAQADKDAKTSPGQAAAKWLKERAATTTKSTSSTASTTSTSSIKPTSPTLSVKSENRSSTPGAPAR